jgi:hypothetical protein
MSLTAMVLQEIDKEIEKFRAAKLEILNYEQKLMADNRRSLAPSSPLLHVLKAIHSPGKRKKRNLSPEGRVRIQQAQQRRWAEKRRLRTAA